MWQAFLRYLQVDRTFLLLVFVFSYLLVISNRVRAGMMSWYVLTPEGPLASFAAAILRFLLIGWFATLPVLSHVELAKGIEIKILGSIS